MEINYPLIVDELSRYYKHLSGVEESISKHLIRYENEIKEVKRLVSFKPEVYTKEMQALEKKVREADIKLSFVVPRKQAILEQISAICKVHDITTPPILID